MPTCAQPALISILSMEGLRPGTAAFTHVNAVADGLSAQGYRVELIADDKHDYTSASLGSRLLRYVRLASKVWKMRAEIDLLYVRSHFAAAPLCKLMAWAGIPIIVEINGLTADMTTTYRWLRPMGQLFELAERALFNSAAGLICVTSDLASKVRAKSATPVHMIGNGVDTKRFKPRSPISPHYAVFFGSLAVWHGVPTLLAALQNKNWPDDLHLVIAGQGHLSKDVRAMAAQDERLDYRGLVDPDEMPAVIAGAVMGISSVELPEQRGLTEVAPLKLMEMLSCGLPVVASCIAGQTILTERAGGRTYEAKDAADLAQVISDFWADKKALSAARLKAREVSEELDWSQIVGRIDEEVVRPLILAKEK